MQVGALLDLDEDRAGTHQGVEDLRGDRHPALGDEGGSHQVGHGDPWVQAVPLGGTRACHPEVSVRGQGSQEKAPAREGHEVVLWEESPLVCLLVYHLGCLASSLGCPACRLLFASGLVLISSCC